MDTASPQPAAQADLQKQFGSHWTKGNVTTLQEWINIAAYNIQILTYAAQHNQRLLRNNIILGLLLSTASGTISAARFGLTSSPTTDLVLNSLFTLMSFVVAIFTGCLKIYSIQENLEGFIKIKQDWTVFCTAIASELQLPVTLRHDALYIIMKHKVKYLDLLKSNPEVPAFCIERVKKEFVKYSDVDLDSTNLPKTMMGIAAMEMKSILEMGDEATQTQTQTSVRTTVTDTVVTENILQNNIVPSTLTVPLLSSKN